jgi:pyridoxal phosphate enzyme (YggS family)
MGLELRLPVAPERLVANLAAVRETIARAAAQAGRASADVALVAVTKYVGVAEIRELLRLGVKDLGESRIQPARPKIAALKDEVAAVGARWRLIGHLQTNKARTALQDFAALDAVDSVHLLEALAQEARKLGLAGVPCLAEINVSGEEQKYGLRPAELPEFLARAAALPECRVTGLMAMAPFSEQPEATSRPVFRALRELRDEANARAWYPAPLKELSMGMTQDYAVAVEEGATLVRVGTALFV